MPSSTSNSNSGSNYDSDSDSNSEPDSRLSAGSDDQQISEISIPYREIPDHPWPKLILVMLVVLVIAVVAWENLARKMHHTPGTYQTGIREMWGEERRKLDQPDKNVRVILTGSSRILWAADLDILEKQLGTRPLQLALPGTSPALFVQDIVDNTQFDGIVLVGVTPFLFNWIGEGIFGGDALESYRNQSPSQWIGMHLHNKLSDHLAFLDEGFSLPELTERYNHLPKRSGAKKLENEQWKLGNIYADRQTDMWEPIESVGSFDHQQILNFWRPGINIEEPKPAEVLDKMAKGAIGFFKPLIEKLKQRGGDIVFIRMPSDGLYKQQDLLNDHRNTLWQPMINGFKAPAVNSMDFAELSSELTIPEWSHLSRESQDIWSTRIVKYIEQAYLTSRGQSIYQVINKPPFKLNEE